MARLCRFIRFTCKMASTASPDYPNPFHNPSEVCRSIFASNRDRARPCNRGSILTEVVKNGQFVPFRLFDLYNGPNSHIRPLRFTSQFARGPLVDFLLKSSSGLGPPSQSWANTCWNSQKIARPGLSPVWHSKWPQWPRQTTQYTLQPSGWFSSQIKPGPTPTIVG